MRAATSGVQVNVTTGTPPASPKWAHRSVRPEASSAARRRWKNSAAWAEYALTTELRGVLGGKWRGVRFTTYGRIPGGTPGEEPGVGLIGGFVRLSMIPSKALVGGESSTHTGFRPRQRFHAVVQ